MYMLKSSPDNAKGQAALAHLDKLKIIFLGFQSLISGENQRKHKTIIRLEQLTISSDRFNLH